MNLTKLERRLLINQFEILKKLEDTDEYDRLITILEEGYSSLYRDVLINLWDELPEADCNFVFEVLLMYRALEDYYEDKGDEELKKNPSAKFSGFDGNNETHLMSFAQFLISQPGHWDFLKDRAAKTDRFNSHMPRVPVYERMLEVWEKSGDKLRLTAEEAKAVVQAARGNDG
ncbi:MAG: YfbU family protein [Myxococcales bacterium]|nr:YfbU family protein [Myxococcales bacterium]